MEYQCNICHGRIEYKGFHPVILKRMSKPICPNDHTTMSRYYPEDPNVIYEEIFD